MSNLLAEGTWPCTVKWAKSGCDEKNVMNVQVRVRIDDGPSAGRECTYEDRVDNKSAPYVRRSLLAIGWSGKLLRTVADDCASWITRTGGASTVEIKHIEIKNGKRAGKIWDKPNAIGRGGARELRAPDAASLADADEALMRAAADDQGGGGGGYDDRDAPPPGDDDFCTSSLSREPRSIARVIGGVL